MIKKAGRNANRFGSFIAIPFYCAGVRSTGADYQPNLVLVQNFAGRDCLIRPPDFGAEVNGDGPRVVAALPIAAASKSVEVGKNRTFITICLRGYDSK